MSLLLTWLLTSDASVPRNARNNSVQLPVRKAAAEGEEKQNLGIQATI